MLRSMTGYGRSQKENQLGRFSVEVQSINRKHFEMQTNLHPTALQRFEPAIRKCVSRQLQRGQINLLLRVHFEKNATQVVKPNLPLVRELKKAWEEIAKEVALPLNSAELFHSLALNPDLLHYTEEFENEEALLSAILEVVDEAVKQLIVMREEEGAHLQKDLFARLGKIEGSLSSITELAKGGSQKYYEKLKNRLEELFTGSVENEEKVLREVAIYAERVDITEEIIRFSSHLKQFRELLTGRKSGGVGKAGDFLLQELFREVNTIGSKSAEIQVTAQVLEIKNELERIREQIQNIE